MNASLAVTAVLNITISLLYLMHGRGEITLTPYVLLWAATLTTSLKDGIIANRVYDLSV